MFCMIVLLTTFVLGVTGEDEPLQPYKEFDGNVGIKFLVTVNDTWDETGCITTVATPMLTSGVKYNQSKSITVGSCDHGPLRFNVRNAEKYMNAKMQVDMIFFSSVIEDASPPTCSIAWNGSYRVPRTTDVNESLLPGCFVMDSREGYHMTYYWFHILDWMFY